MIFTHYFFSIVDSNSQNLINNLIRQDTMVKHNDKYKIKVSWNLANIYLSLLIFLMININFICLIITRFNKKFEKMDYVWNVYYV